MYEIFIHAGAIHLTPHTAQGVLYSVKTLTGWFKSSYVIMGFIGTFLLSSCNELSTTENQISESTPTENRSFCNPANGGNCALIGTFDMEITYQGCKVPITFKVTRCIINPGQVVRYNIHNFQLLWQQMLPCAKIGYLNDAIPLGPGNGDWSEFLLRYAEFFRAVTNAAEMQLLNEEIIPNTPETNNWTLNWIESNCLKFCNALISANDPQLPGWSEHICSTEGCCFRERLYIHNPNTGKLEIATENIAPGNQCLNQIQINCPPPSIGSSCQEPCGRL